MLGKIWPNPIPKGTMVKITALLPQSLDTGLPEGVTQAIHQIGEPSHSDEEIYRWIQDKLRARAEMVLRRLRRHVRVQLH